jgi:hypothetical protein
MLDEVFRWLYAASLHPVYLSLTLATAFIGYVVFRVYRALKDDE